MANDLREVREEADVGVGGKSVSATSAQAWSQECVCCTGGGKVSCGWSGGDGDRKRSPGVRAHVGRSGVLS